MARRIIVKLGAEQPHGVDKGVDPAQAVELALEGRLYLVRRLDARHGPPPQ
jgi:hypothetical protein